MGMSWLKKVGEVIAKGAALATGLSPLVDPFFDNKKEDKDKVFGKITDSLVEIQSVITTVEAIGQLTGLKGEDKLKAAAPMIASILESKLVAGRKIEDKVLFASGASTVADGMVKILNSLSEGDVKE